MSARHAVAGDQLVPANLSIARVVRPPCQFGFPVARIAGQVTVIVGHGRTGVVPPQGAVFPHPVFGPGSHVEPGRGRQPHAVRSGGQRHELAPHARIADFAVLETPGRIVEVVAVRRKASSTEERRVPRTDGGTMRRNPSVWPSPKCLAARNPAVRAFVKTPSTCMSRPVRASTAAATSQPRPAGRA